MSYMKGIGTMQYDVNHEEIIIDEEFQKLLPPLGEKVFSDLEKSLLEHGVRDPLVLWNGILIDGYNRYTISQKHGLTFNTVSMKFPSRDHVTVWIIENQMERRNLTPLENRRYRGLHYNTMKRIIRNETGKNQHTEVWGQNEPKPQSENMHERTSDLLAGQYNVSPSTIKRDAQVANALEAIGKISPDVKMDILSGRTRISNRQLQELSSASEKEIRFVITQIEDGTFESRRSVTSGGDKTTDEPDYADMQPWEKQFTKMTDEFRQTLRAKAKPDDTTEVKTALRQYISMLEDLYGSI